MTEHAPNATGLAGVFDRITSLKLRLSIVILAGIGAAVAVVSIGRGFGIGWLGAAALGTLVALLLVRSLAHGATSRIRDLALAAEALAAGDHDRRVEVRGRDEVTHLAAAFNQMADQLTGLDRMRRSFVADASHELRTPITAARAVLENMVDGVEPATPERLGPVLAQVERLGRLVEQLLDLSRLESDPHPTADEPVDLAALAFEVAAAARMADAAASIDVAADRPVLTMGDPERLRQVLTNLVGNAVRHAPHGTAVEVRVEAGDRCAVLSVSDRGQGIAPEERDRVFERFARGDAARATRDGGAGLGLAIVKRIVEQHAGTIEVGPVDARLDAGAPGCQMTVTLPAATTAGLHASR